MGCIISLTFMYVTHPEVCQHKEAHACGLKHTAIKCDNLMY